MADHLDSPAGFFRHGDGRADADAMTDGVSGTDSEEALGEAKTEGNLSRATVVRKIRRRRSSSPHRISRSQTTPTGPPGAATQCVATAAAEVINRGSGGRKLPSWWRAGQ